MNLTAWVDLARRRGCPLLAVPTPEPLGAAQALQRWSAEQDHAAWSWDCMSGILPLTVKAEEHGGDDRLNDPVELLRHCRSLPATSLVIAHWHNEYWQDSVVRQGVLNLRDYYKANGRTLLLLGRELIVHRTLASDFMHYRESLPDTDELAVCVDNIEHAARISGTPREAAIDALRGMTGFEAEQQLAMAASREGIDISALWQAKIKLINNVPGLQCWQGGESESDVKGLDALLQDFRDMRDGRLPVRLVIWVDESEDVLAGVKGDTSGVSQDYLGTLAKHIQDTEAQSILLAGHPGTGKSLSAKAAGSLFNCLVLALDLGGCKGSLVGESESNLRHALAIERAIVGDAKGSTLWIWTTNNAEALPHKLRARMQGEYFCDLPGEQEALSIWSLYRAKYKIDQGEAFPANCDGWTGREIARCCRLAWQYRRTLTEASTRIVPIRISQRQAIEERRQRAHGRYLDASKGSVYQFNKDIEQGRKVQL